MLRVLSSWETLGRSALRALHTCFLSQKTPKAAALPATPRAVSDMPAHADTPGSRHKLPSRTKPLSSHTLAFS